MVIVVTIFCSLSSTLKVVTRDELGINFLIDVCSSKKVIYCKASHGRIVQLPDCK